MGIHYSDEKNDKCVVAKFIIAGINPCLAAYRLTHFLDLLTQYQLLNEAVYITKNCPLKQIKEISQVK